MYVHMTECFKTYAKLPYGNYNLDMPFIYNNDMYVNGTNKWFKILTDVIISFTLRAINKCISHYSL